MQHVPNDRTYYMRREQQCRALARNAANPSIRKLHTDFAERYAAMLRDTCAGEEWTLPTMVPANDRTVSQ